MSSLISKVLIEYRLGKEGREYNLNFRSTGKKKKDRQFL